jgi:hypothetical protein
MMSYVYWVYNESCQDFMTDGYVGVTDYLKNRIDYHLKRNSNIPNDTKLKYEILFEGSRDECFKKEEEYRPTKGIGWNRAKGGSHGWTVEFSHSDKTKQKLKDAWTYDRKEKASKPRPEHSEKLKGRKKPEHSLLMSGEGNPMFGKTHSSATRKKISEAHSGKKPWNKGLSIQQEKITCPHCGKEGGKGNMKRYHFENCKDKIDE